MERPAKRKGDKPTMATIDRCSISIEHELSTQTSFKKLARAKYTFLQVGQILTPLDTHDREMVIHRIKLALIKKIFHDNTRIDRISLT